jgi:hypothetical protein
MEKSIAWVIGVAVLTDVKMRDTTWRDAVVKPRAQVRRAGSTYSPRGLKGETNEARVERDTRRWMRAMQRRRY